jgi:hypothetical protein
MAGGGTSALLAAAGVSVQTRFLLGAPLLLATVVLASRAMVRGDQGGGGVSFVRPRGALPALALVTFCAVTAEGSMSDWSGVYLRRVLGARSDGGFRRRGPGRWPSGRRPPHRAHWPSGARARLRGAVLRERPLEATQADAALAAIAVVHLAVGECAPEPPDEVDHTRVVSAGSPGAK